MPRPLQLILLGICCFGFVQQVFAQDAPSVTVTAEYTQQPLAAILTDLADQTGFLFYFRAEDLPPDRRSFSFQQTPLPLVLEELLQQSGLSHAFYRDYAILIASTSIISEVYTADYYDILRENLTTSEDDSDQKPDRNTLTVGSLDALGPSGQARVQVWVINRRTENPIVGAVVRWVSTDRAEVTDENGQFTTRVPPGTYELLLEYIGYREQKVQLDVRGNGSIVIEMRRQATDLQEVVVTESAPDENLADARSSVNRLDIKSLQKAPTLMGEADVVKGLLLYAGVSTVGEGATGFNVRGGEVDQNLFLQDEAFLFNSTHALGFFSAFNPDLVSRAELYKGIIPAHYGGRLASVLDVETKEGNFESIRMKAGISPISSRLSLEGPLIEDKLSFIGGVRFSYINWLLRQIKVAEVQRSKGSFFDGNLKLTHRVDKTNTLNLSIYQATDDFNYNEEFGFNYRTFSGELGLRSILNNKHFNRLSLVYSRYTSEQSDQSGLSSSIFTNQISYYKLKNHFRLQASEVVEWEMGVSAILYRTQPGKLSPFSENSLLVPRQVAGENGLESALFAQANWTLTPALIVQAGLRISAYQFLGPHTSYIYDNPERPLSTGIIDTQTINGIVADYYTPEPRLSLRYRFNPNSSVKGGYSRTAQYINQVFNSDSPTPTSQYQLSTDYIPPQRSHNFSLGYFRNFADNLIESSVEVYYRAIDQLYDYKDFARLQANDHLETELLQGHGRAYGLELSVYKKSGFINGRFSYTLSKTERQVAGINDNAWYPSSFDRPHDLSLVFNIQPNERNTITFNFSYGTGRPITVPLGTYRIENTLLVPIYSDRNAFRIPDYHRLDLAYTLGQGYNKTKKIKTSWTLSIYNLYGRRNAFSFFFKQSPSLVTKGNQLSILGGAFPALTLNISTI